MTALSRADLDALRFRDEAEFQRARVAHHRERGRLVSFIPDWMHRLALASLRRQRRGDRDWPDPGAPDLLVVDPLEGVVTLEELKLNTGSLSAVQRPWRDAIARCERVEYRLLRPKDWRPE